MQLHIDTSNLTTTMRQLQRLGTQAPRAIYSALNRTLTFVVKTVRKDVRSTYEVKAKDLKENLKIDKPSLNNLQGSLKSSGRLLTLQHFKVKPARPPRQKRVPVSSRQPLMVKIKKQEGFKAMSGPPAPFMQRMKNVKNVFVRETKKSMPVKSVRTVSFPQMVGNTNNLEQMKIQAEEMLFRRLEHEINYRLNRIRGSGGGSVT